EFCESGDRFTGTVCYRGDRYAAEEVRRMARWLGVLLSDVPAHLREPVRAISLLGDDDPPVRTPPSRSERPAAAVLSGPPLDDLQKRIAAAWSAVLGVQDVGVEDEFFELGGTSLRMIILHKRLCAELGAQVPLRALFDAPTVRAMALALRPEQAQVGQRD